MTFLVSHLPLRDGTLLECLVTLAQTFPGLRK
ncbi:putative salivary gland protein 16 [Frankliniella occidentalis]|nr:putative salivary gland protein 16 [Frankliniella occidentalis]